MTFYNQHSTALVGSGSENNQGGYTIERSLRFRGSASAYLSRTPASAGNRKTWTYSVWFKRGTLGTSQDLLVAGSSVFGQHSTQIGFRSGPVADVLQLVDSVAGVSLAFELFTSQVFRDPSAWYHLVVAIDTTQATSSNRAKMYINGSQITAFSTATYASQNHDTAVNNNVLHHIGRFTSASANPFDGYMTEINFIDGQQLDPSYFGETDAITGVWKPKAYAGTYGTNGFYLNFSDNTSTTTLGYDQSSNSNNWTTNNISLTAGSTYDSMTDVPTLTSASAGNFCTLSAVDKSSRITLSNGNLSAINDNTGNHAMVRGTLGMAAGKWYWEVIVPSMSGNPQVDIIGIQDGATATTVSVGGGGVGAGWGYNNTSANLYTSGFTASGTVPALSAGTIGFAYDADAGKLWFRKTDGNWQQGDPAAGTSASATMNTLGTTMLPAMSFYNYDQGTFNFNFGQRPFTYTPPTGYKALNTYNLPDSTVKDGGEYFNAVTYTGNGSSLAVTGVGFQPDFVWYKQRNTARDNGLEDSVRGASKILISNSTNAEVSASGISSFNSDGFTVQSNVIGNQSGGSYVAWNWKANGSGVSNTDGSITSTVSANTTSGFSIVTYTGNSTSGATVGHGLGVAPAMFIVKSRVQARGWNVYHTSLGNTKYIQLQSTAAPVTNSAWWNNTSPSSSTFTLGNDNDVNGSTQNYLAYCFAPVEGYSAFGSYTGNGSNDGPFVYTGFRPAMVFYRTLNYTSNTAINDSARDPYNVIDTVLYANLSNADDTNASQLGVDYLSNGFKIRGVNGTINKNGYTQIYAAFAENPFKYSLAR